MRMVFSEELYGYGGNLNFGRIYTPVYLNDLIDRLLILVGGAGGGTHRGL